MKVYKLINIENDHDIIEFEKPEFEKSIDDKFILHINDVNNFLKCRYFETNDMNDLKLLIKQEAGNSSIW